MKMANNYIFTTKALYLPQSNKEMPEMQEMTNAQIGTIRLTQDMVREKLLKLNVNKW